MYIVCNMLILIIKSLSIAGRSLGSVLMQTYSTGLLVVSVLNVSIYKEILTVSTHKLDDEESTEVRLGEKEIRKAGIAMS